MSRILIAGLGNPGPKYAETRHNMGFMVADRLAAQHNASFRKPSGRPCLEADLHISTKGVVLIKPQTYMNRSGIAVQLTAAYYRIGPSDLLVVHDDLDLPLGRMKFVRGGGAGGHNGIRSIIEQLGTRDFPRLKIGIGRPEGPIPVDRYVLSPFSPKERPVVELVVDAASEAVVHFVENGIESAMNRFNGLEVSP